MLQMRTIPIVLQKKQTLFISFVKMCIPLFNTYIIVVVVGTTLNAWIMIRYHQSEPVLTWVIPALRRIYPSSKHRKLK